MKQTLILSLLACLFIFAQCKKDKNSPEPDNPYGLPNATQTGANIFACRINGVNWISKTGSSNMGGGYLNDTLFARGNMGNGNYFELIVLRIDGSVQQGGIYSISQNSPAKIYLSSNKNCLCPNGGCSVFNSYAVSGQITITKINTANEIISGVFNGKIPIPNCDTLNINDGRFDVRYF